MEAERPEVIRREAPSTGSGQALRVLGVDVGERRIGVALSDPTGTLVSPLPAIQRSNLEEDIRAVVHLAIEHQVKAIVVGLPISLNGRMERQARLVQRFIRALAEASPVPVRSQDERFSTVEAERLLQDGGHQPSREKGLRDSASAAVILRAYLDSERNR